MESRNIISLKFNTDDLKKEIKETKEINEDVIGNLEKLLTTINEVGGIMKNVSEKLASQQKVDFFYFLCS